MIDFVDLTPMFLLYVVVTGLLEMSTGTTYFTVACKTYGHCQSVERNPWI